MTIQNTLSVAGGTIQLNGGTLSVSTGIAFSSGAQLTGFGTVNASVNGAGAVIAAAGGSLTLANTVGNNAGSVPSLALGNGSTLYLTSSSGIGTGSAPTLTFQGTGDLFQAINAGFTNFYLGTISGFSGTDLIKIHSIGTGDTLTWNGDKTITIKNAGTGQSETFTFDSTTTASQVRLSESATVDTLSVICFLAGTMIRTPEGEVAIETLKRGDLVLTTEGEARPVTWLGKQTVSSRFADPIRSSPIRVKAGALGENVPARDLLVSPDHALLIDGVLVHAGALVNDLSIVRETWVPECFVYYHIELDDHSLILAESVPAETFVDNVDRMNFDNWAEHEAVYPDGKPISELPYPRAKARRQLPASIRNSLAKRAIFVGVAERSAA